MRDKPTSLKKCEDGQCICIFLDHSMHKKYTLRNLQNNWLKQEDRQRFTFFFALRDNKTKEDSEKQQFHEEIKSPVTAVHA